MMKAHQIDPFLKDGGLSMMKKCRYIDSNDIMQTDQIDAFHVDCLSMMKECRQDDNLVALKALQIDTSKDDCFSTMN